MKSKILIFATVLAVLLISGNIFSQEFRQGNRERDEMGNRDRIHEKLNLTNEQIDEIDALKLSHRKEMINLKADVEQKEVELAELKNTINYSRDAYLNKVKNIIAAKDKIAIARANYQMDVYQLLDDNQKKEWNKKTKMMHGKKHRMVKMMRDKDFD